MREKNKKNIKSTSFILDTQLMYCAHYLLCSYNYG